jgi:hypothetical protein
VPGPYTDEQLERAVDALSEPERLRGAETMVAAAAPGLQRVLVSALQAGGWFEEAHAAEIRKAIELEDPDERVTAVRTLMAEEARMGMMVGVAVGWALAEELRTNETED